MLPICKHAITIYKPLQITWQNIIVSYCCKPVYGNYIVTIIYGNCTLTSMHSDTTINIQSALC